MVNRIQGTTTLYGLIGYPLKHSRSPHMHNSAFEALGLDHVYMVFEVKAGLIKEALEAFKVLGVKGGNITMPHKTEVVKHLDEISPDAKIIGSVNTIKIDEEGKVSGFNTDGKGLVKALDEAGVNYKGEKIVILGAGGAARAVAIQLAYDGAKEVVIANRTLSKAEEIVNRINENIPESKGKAIELDEIILREELKDASIFINCTSKGMKNPDESPIEDINLFHKGLFVVDIIYDPLKTRFLSLAEEAGCKIMNGIDMMIYQGALAFKIWTGEEMPVDYIKEVLFKTK